MGLKKVYICMGVSGSGKSTIGYEVAQVLNCQFFDGDAFHPKDNIEKMSKGQALNDTDRMPWLMAINEHIIGQTQTTVYACSALKKKYRDILAKDVSSLKFIYLRGSFDLIYKRMAKRKEHFMPPELLKSQFEALEEPLDAIVVDITKSKNEILNYLKKELK